MGIKVGINGFGRIGRNILRAALGSGDLDFVAVNDLTTTGTLAHLLKYDSILGNLDATIEATGDGISVNGDKFKVTSEKDPVEASLGRAGRRRRVRVDRHLHRSRRRGEAPRGRRQARDHHRAGEEARRHGGDGRQSRELRSVEAPDRLERVVHDQLSRAARQGAARELRHPEGLDDDDPLVHQRSGDARLPAQGPAPRARRRPVDDSDDDRRGGGGGRSAAAAQGQARWLLDARADAERLGGRPRGARRQDRDGRGAQRGVRSGGGRSAEGHPRGGARAARVERLQEEPALVDHRRAQHEGDGRQLRQGAVVVRQRVGLLVALRRSACKFMAKKGL